MGFFEIIGIITFLYFLINIILWVILDTDIELFWNEKFGLPISTLKGKVVWITGASSGIGKHLAIALAKNGVKLCISARRTAELEKVQNECLLVSNSQLSANDVLVLSMDMLDLDAHTSHFDTVIKHFGTLDVLVNNAGRSQRAKWQEIELTVDRQLFDLDVFSVVNLSRIFARYIERNKINGHIVVTSSGIGLVAMPGSATYAAAKHALHGYFNALRLEMPQMDVTIFCPGPTVSEFLENAFTHTPGESYGQPVRPTDRRMTTERCGTLMALAIANKIHLSFMGPFPVTLVLYIACYYPNFMRYVVYKLIGNKGLNTLREGNKTK